MVASLLISERMDLRSLVGPRTEAMQEDIANAPERWRRFLGANEEAAEFSSGS